MSATDVVTGRSTGVGRIGDSPARPDGIIKAQGDVRLLVGPADRRCGCGAPRCARRTRTPASSPIDTSPAWAIAGRGRRHHRRRRARQGDVRADRRRPAGVRRATSCATSASRSPRWPPTTPRRAAGRSPRSTSPTRCSTRCSTRRRRSTASHPPIHPDGNVLRHQRIVLRRRRRHRRRRRRGHVRDRHAGPGVPRARGGARRARPRRPRRRAAHRHAVAARGPQADRRLPRPARGRGAARARRRRRGVRRPRGHQPAGPHLPAGAAPRAAGAHGLQPGRELPRPRPPPPGDDLDAPPRHARTARSSRSRPASCSTAGAYASTSSAVLLNAITHTQGPYRCPNAVVDGLRRAHQPPAVRGDARLRRRPGVLRPREPDGPARRGVRARPGRGPPAQRHGHRRPADHRAGRRERGAGRPLHPRDGGAADAGHADRRRARRRRRRRPDAPARAAPASPPTSATCGAASAGAWRSRT